MGQAQINVRTRACSRTSIARTKQAALTHNVRGKELISPSSAGLSQLLRECEKFGTRHDVKYNAKKSAVMIYRSMTLKGCTIPNFNLNGMILHVVASYNYLGHYITDDLSDDDDINRQRRTLFVQGNIILRKFNMCSLGVKLTLFRTYCSPMYTAQL